MQYLSSLLPATRARWLAFLGAAVLVLNLIDGVITLALVTTGTATEANPLMAVALEDWGPVPFMMVKLAMVSLGVLLLWRLRHRRSALVAMGSAAAVYAALLLYHVKSAHVLATFFLEQRAGMVL
jgi:hypothetical protein